MPEAAPTRHRLDIAAIAWRVATIARLRYAALFGIALLVFGPLNAVDAVLTGFSVESGEDVGPIDAGELAGAGITLVVLLLGAQIYAGVVTAVARETVTGERSGSLLQLMAHQPLIRLVIADLLAAGAIMVGLILLIVPGVVLYARLAIVGPLVDLERPGPVAVLGRSFRLTKGNTIRILVMLAALLAFQGALSGLLDLLIPGDEGLVLRWLSATAAAVLISPILALVAVVITFDLRRHEAGGVPSLTP